MTDHYDVIIICTGTDGMPVVGNCDGIVYQIDQEHKSLVSSSSVTRVTHTIET